MPLDRGNPTNQIGNAMLPLRQMTPTWAKAPARRLIWQYRQATSRSRRLPDFIIVGAQRSGTTSLYKYLGQHPQLLPSYKKEVHFFDGGLDSNVDNFEKGQAWYRSHFPWKTNATVHSKTFEASPFYIFNPLVPRRIYGLVPEVKIIALLRNPTERAISHYFHEKWHHREPLSIKEALRQEERRLKPVIENEDYKNDIYMRHSYKSRGLYKEQIERFVNYFPWQQILVLSSESFFSEPHSILRRVFDFVGVDAGFKARDVKPRNVTPNRSEVDPDVYEYLNDYSLRPNQARYELVGRSYGW